MEIIDIYGLTMAQWSVIIPPIKKPTKLVGKYGLRKESIRNDEKRNVYECDDGYVRDVYAHFGKYTGVFSDAKLPQGVDVTQAVP